MGRLPESKVIQLLITGAHFICQGGLRVEQTHDSVGFVSLDRDNVVIFIKCNFNAEQVKYKNGLDFA